MSTPIKVDFSKNVGLLAAGSALGLSFSAEITSDPDVVAALASDGPFPDRDIDLGHIGVSAATPQDITFSGPRGTVAFSGSASAFSSVGVFHESSALLAALSLGAEVAPGVDFHDGPDAEYLLLRWGYDLKGSAQGSIALGAGGGVTFGVDASREGMYAVVRQLPKALGARSALEALANSWRLPTHVDDLGDIDPGTHLIAEVDGSLAVRLGAQFGYDFNWIRAAQLGGLSGDVGLHIQLGVSVAVGFDLSAKYAVVLSRGSTDPADTTVRLRLYKLAKKGWSFAFDANADVTPVADLLPSTFEDFVSAVFGVHGPQIVKDLDAIRAWTDPDRPLPGLLAGLSSEYVKRLLATLTGVDPESAFDLARGRVLGLLDAWNGLDHRVATAIWKVVGEHAGSPAFDELKRFVSLVASADRDSFREELGRRLSAVDFFTTPVGMWLESALTDGILTSVTDSAAFERLKATATATLGLLDGSFVEDILKKLQAYVDEHLGLDTVEEVVDAATLAKLDEWLQKKLSDLIGHTIDFSDVDTVRRTIRLLLDKGKEFYEKSVTALKRTYAFSLAATYQKTTTRDALVDVTFDLSVAGAGALLRQAVDGQFDTLFVEQRAGVTINTAVLTYGINRQTSVEVNLPWYTSTVTEINDALAKVTAMDESDGRILVYDLQAEDIVSRKNKRNSRLAVGAHLPIGAGVRVHTLASLGYSYSFKQAIAAMRTDRLYYQLKPYVTKYLPDAFGGMRDGAPVESFDTWVHDLDRAIDAVEHNGSSVFGNTLLSLSLSLPSEAAGAWFRAPVDPRSKTYMTLSRGIQASLKDMIPFYYFQDPGRYEDLDTAAALLAYVAILPSTSARFDGHSLTPNTDRDVYWNWVDQSLRSAMLRNPLSMARLHGQLQRAFDRLNAIPGFSHTAGFYEPTHGTLDRVCSTVEHGIGRTLLEGLLFNEVEIVRGACSAAVDLATFAATAASKPSEAVKRLTEFGQTATATFNAKVATVFGGEMLQPFGTMLFAECTRLLSGEATAATPSAVLELIVLKGDRQMPPSGFPDNDPPTSDEVVLQQRIVSL